MAWALGYVPLLNVPILLPESTSNRAGIELTDADVFGVMFSPNGEVSRILIDCKTTEGRAVDRVLWVKGLHTFLSINQLYLFKKKIPNNARWLAEKLDVNCLDEDELILLEEHLGLHRLKGPYFDGTGYEQLRQLLISFPKGSDYRAVVNFLTGGVWTLPPSKRVITLMNFGGQNDINKKLRPDQRAHVALVLQGTLMFAISLGLLAREINVADTLNVEKCLREILHGGAELLEQKIRYLEVVNRLSVESGTNDVSITIDFPSFPLLLEQIHRLIVRRYELNNAIRVIDLALHYFAANSTGLHAHLGKSKSPLPAKIASDVLALFVRSNGLDEGFSTAITDLLALQEGTQKEDASSSLEHDAYEVQMSLLEPLPPIETKEDINKRFETMPPLGFK